MIPVLIILYVFNITYINYRQANKTKHHHHNMSHHNQSYANEVHSAWETWSTDMESAIDSSFFWGYLVTQIPGGFLASFFPANRIFGVAIVGSAFCNMFIPLCIYLNPIILIVVRVIQGLVEVNGIYRILVASYEHEL